MKPYLIALAIVIAVWAAKPVAGVAWWSFWP